MLTDDVTNMLLQTFMKDVDSDGTQSELLSLSPGAISTLSSFLAAQRSEWVLAQGSTQWSKTLQPNPKKPLKVVAQQMLNC